LALIEHRKETNTYYAKCAGYSFHGTDVKKIAVQLDSVICQVPDCRQRRYEQSGRLSYLCSMHYEEACREEAALAKVKTTGLLLAEPDWNTEAFTLEDVDENTL
jgi:hypothetical protein